MKAVSFATYRENRAKIPLDAFDDAATGRLSGRRVVGSSGDLVGREKPAVGHTRALVRLIKQRTRGLRVWPTVFSSNSSGE